MAYYGNQPIAGETNSFKVLDDISSYTKTFDGSSAAVVSTSDDTLTFYDHRFIQGQRVTYGKGSGTVITGLTDATVYYVIREDKDTIKLAETSDKASALDAITLSAVGSAAGHTLNVAFDGTNTKFKATTGGGTHIKLTRPGQLMISMNGVVQEPQNNTPSNGFGIEGNNVIVFSTAPTVLDTFWGHYLTTNLSSWELSDNKIDNFTGDGSTTTYTLSKTPANADNILVTIDGVTQYPSDSSTTRAYSLSASVVTFTSAPTLNAAIAVRHIGFAGGSGGGTGGVTGFYGRTGNVSMVRSDLQNTDIYLNNITGVAATFTGNVSIGGTLTYMDVTNVDAVGIITAQEGIHFGIGATAGKFEAATGITTLSSLKVSNLTSGRVTYAGSGGELVDSANLTFNGADLLIDASTNEYKGVKFDNSFNLTFGSSAGTSPRIYLQGTSNGQSDAGDTFFATGTGGVQKFRSNTYTKFEVNADNTTVEALRINSDGELGIGTDDPGMPLHLDCAVQNAVKWVSSNSDGPLIHYYNGSTHLGAIGNSKGVMSSSNLHFGIGSKSDLLFGTKPSGGGSTVERLRIKSDGKVGINTATFTSAQFVVKNSDDSNLNTIEAWNDNGNVSTSISQDSNGAGSLAQKDNAGNIKTFIRSYDASYFLGGDIGIGTAIPSNALDVQAGTTNTAIVARSTDAKAQVSLVDNTTTSVGSVVIGAEGDDLFLTSGSGGTERLRISSTGLIFVNRDAVGGRIDATAGDASMTFSDGNGRQTVKIATMASGQSKTHVFDGSGRFLSGTTTYKSNLNSSADTSGQLAQFVGAADDTSKCVSIFAYSGTSNPAARGAKLQLHRARSTDGTTNTAVAADDLIGSIEFKGNDATSFTASARIDSCVESGTIATDRIPGNLKFYTSADDTAVPQERLRIKADGNSDFYANHIHLYNNVDTSNTYFYAQNTGAGNAGIKMKNNQGEWTIIANDRLRFIDDDASLERLCIDSNGDVGLGIFPPVPQDTGAKTLHIHHPDTSGSTARAGLRLTTGISGSAVSNGGFLGIDYSNNLYLYNQENGDLRIGTDGEQRLCITNTGDFYLNNNPTKQILPQYVTTFGCDAQTWVKFATVNGDQLSSEILMTMHDTTSSVVFSASYHIKVGHYEDIWIESRDLAYSSMGVKIVSDNDEDFDIYGKRNGGASSTTSSNVTVHIIPLNGETVTFNNTVNYSGQELIHTTSQGTLKISGAGGVGGHITIPGTITKGTDNFRIPHPLAGLTSTTDLVHSVIEGPQLDLIYRGKTNLVAGIATVNVDTKAGMTEGTFVSLCKDIQCFTSNETGWTNVKGSVNGNKITIVAQDNSCTDTISWMVVGERKDDNAKSALCTDADGNLIIEPLRDEPPDTSHLAEYYPTS